MHAYARPLTSKLASLAIIIAISLVPVFMPLPSLFWRFISAVHIIISAAIFVSVLLSLLLLLGYLITVPGPIPFVSVLLSC